MSSGHAQEGSFSQPSGLSIHFLVSAVRVSLLLASLGIATIPRQRLLRCADIALFLVSVPFFPCTLISLLLPHLPHGCVASSWPFGVVVDCYSRRRVSLGFDFSEAMSVHGQLDQLFRRLTGLCQGVRPAQFICFGTIYIGASASTFPFRVLPSRRHQ